MILNFPRGPVRDKKELLSLTVLRVIAVMSRFLLKIEKRASRAERLCGFQRLSKMPVAGSGSRLPLGERGL
jgi:hypothetical protein